MATLNVRPVAHGSKTENYADGTSIRFNVYATASRVDNARVAKVQRAMAILDRLAASEPAAGQCNAYFRTLGSNTTFTALWQNPAVFVNHSPSSANGFYAACHSNNRDLTVTSWCLDSQNRWMVAATLCHELAHAAGAPGSPNANAPATWTPAQRATAHRAELAADRCYFGAQYDPSIYGSVEGLYRLLTSRFA